MSDVKNEWLNAANQAQEEQPEPPRPDLPPIEHVILERSKLPELKPELIKDLLRQNAVMLLTGASKMGKTFLLGELALAFASGGKWLGYKCKQSHVLYINLEVESAEFMHRLTNTSDALNMTNIKEAAKHIDVWTLRGYKLTFDDIIEQLRVINADKRFDAVFIDPIYPIFQGDENSSRDSIEFFNNVARLAVENDAAVILCHHHSKGTQDGKRSLDRGSGSGVFGRAVDLNVDIVEVNVDETASRAIISHNGSETALQVEFSCRSFKSPSPIGLWWQYPKHVIDDTGLIDQSFKNRKSNSNSKKGEVLKACESLISKAENEGSDGVPLNALVKEVDASKTTVKNHIEQSNIFELVHRGSQNAAFVVRAKDSMTALDNDDEVTATSLTE